MTFTDRHSKWLQDRIVKQWYEKTYRRSKTNANVLLRNLGLFCERNDLTPMAIIEMARDTPDRLVQIFNSYIERLRKEGKEGSYITKYKTTINNWCRYYGETTPDSKVLSFKITNKIEGANETNTVWKEHVPTQTELHDIIVKATPRGRVCIALMAFSGLRPESIGDENGEDGIKLSDIEGLDLKDISFGDFKASRITVRRNLSKTRREYFTFISPEGQKYIQEYLKERRKAGEELTEDSPLIAFSMDKKGSYHIRSMPRTLLITREIRTAFRKLGFQQRPYVLRRYFLSALSIAESKGLITHEDRLFIAGHVGDIQSVYTRQKGNLNLDIVNQMRDSYLKSAKFFETSIVNPAEESESLEKKVKIMFLTMSGFSQEEAEVLADLSDEDLQKKMKEKLGMKILNGNSQKVISMAEVEKYITEGFEFVSPLPNDRCIIRAPK